MLIESAAKVFCSILGKRVQNVLDAEGLEEQNGFTPARGGADGIFSLKASLQKRKEHRLETYAVFVDLIKAFDSVPLDGLFAVLEKFGFPPKFCNMVKAFHTGLKVKIGISGK